LKKMLLMDFLMPARRDSTWPYTRCRMVLRKSRSRGSSLSKRSRSYPQGEGGTERESAYGERVRMRAMNESECV
jgi:hypothetical protein